MPRKSRQFDKDIELAKIQARIAYTQGQMFTATAVVIAVVVGFATIASAKGGEAYAIGALMMSVIFSGIIIIIS